LGTLGVETRNVELRTGLSSKQVTSFGFAAKLAGQDVSIFERAMRGLTQAVEDDSVQGQRAQGWLNKFGVDIRGVREGTVGTGEVFVQVAQGLSKMTNDFEPSLR